MVKINTDLSEGKKFLGHFFVKVTDIKLSQEKSKNGKEYTSVILSIDLDGGNTQKIFFKLPWDAWTQSSGEKSLFQQFKEATGLKTEQLQDTDNYSTVPFAVEVGPTIKWGTSDWKTYGEKSDKVSATVIGIHKYDLTDEEIKKINERCTALFARANKETQAKLGTAIATDEDLNF